jgi:hypothetical protein
MNIFTLFAVASQSMLTLYFMITHWIPLYPWNDLQHSSFAYERPLNAFMNCIQIALIVGFAYQINWLMVTGLIFWSLWMYGHLMAWWVPYFFGASEDDMRDYEQTFGKTYKFFPTHDNYPAPDACHTFIGFLTCLVLPSVYAAYFFDGHAITLYSSLFGIFIGLCIFGFFACMTALSRVKK